MELNINGVVVSFENTGSVSKGGKEILQANGVKLQDGTTLYIKAYRGDGLKKENSAKVQPTIRRSQNAKTTPQTDAPDMAALVSAAVAKAIASLQAQEPKVATVAKK